MHWISLIGFFIILSICKAQPTTFKSFETGNTNKGGTFQAAPSGNNAHMSGLKSDADASVHVDTHNLPPGSSVKIEKDGQNSLKMMASSGNNNYCYIISPMIIAVLMAIIHF